MKIEILSLKLSKPAQRALLGAGITSLEQIQNMTEKELLELHGIGKSTIKTIELVLSEYGMHIKDIQNPENGC
ncbi:MAG: hypothetical protein HGA53_02315 [Anaerolineaceae bacterium]|nr:hypothetical protein [Anaerolineaceae bacterium]